MMRKLMIFVLALALGGCAGLPTGLDIETGPELTSPEQQEIAYFSPSGPATGATPAEIVNGFLAAGTGPQNDYAIAREFLSEGFAARWRPGGQTLIRVGGYELQEAGDSLQVASLTIGATIDQFGRFEAVPPSTTNLRFRLALEEGEWRITSAPNLTVVTIPVFGVVFSQFPIFFLDSTSTQLVPDLRWFPSRASIATQLVSALLEGPQGWLNDSVLSAIPAGTQLQVNAVLVQEGVAVVDLDANAIAADNRQRGLLLTQLRSTLLQLPGVLDVVVSIAGARQDIEPSPIAPLPPAASFALTDNGIVRLTGSEAGVLVGSDEIVQRLSPQHIAVGNAGQILAVSNTEGVFRLLVSDVGYETKRLSETGQVVDLQVDGFGNLWVFRDSQENQIEIIDSSGGSQLLTLPFGTRIVSAALSPEGARLAVLASNGTLTIRIYGVVRNQSGLPLRLASSIEVEPAASRVVSISWYQPSFLRALEKTAAGLAGVTEYPLSGPKVPRLAPPVPGLVLETGFALIDSYMLSEAGDVWQLSNNSWRRLITDARDISTGR